MKKIVPPTETEIEIVNLVLDEMLHSETVHFNICDINSCAEVLGIKLSDRSQNYRLAKLMHCKHVRDLTPKAAEVFRVAVYEMLGFKVKASEEVETIRRIK